MNERKNEEEKMNESERELARKVLTDSNFKISNGS
jgi:hypothetical protein